jgi:hypothetical protein
MGIDGPGLDHLDVAVGRVEFRGQRRIDAGWSLRGTTEAAPESFGNRP